MKKCLILVLLVCAGLMGNAENISEQKARQQAVEFISQRGSTRTGAVSVERVYLPLSTTAAHWSAVDAPIYAYNCSEGGYVIVSGDDRTAAVLGFSRKGKLDAEHLPENMLKWLQGYASKIERIQQGRLGIRQSVTRSTSVKDDIESKLKTTWGQYYPYNLHAPKLRLKWEKRDTTVYAATGCMATAMAQILNYYRYPSQTLGEVTGYEETARVPVYSSRKGKVDTLLVDYKTETIAQGTKINWDNIVDAYDILDEEGVATQEYNNTEQQREAVSRLMQYCGVASGMLYGLESSAASYGLFDAILNVFGYEDSYILYQDEFDAEEWVDVIYNEMAVAGPVMFAGFTHSSGGHQFILDGYQAIDGSDYFYVNWGWDGDFDGYMLLDVLDPGWIYNEDGEREGFTEYQEIICGLGPKGVGYTKCPMPSLTVYDMSFGTPDKTYSRKSQADAFEVDVYDMIFLCYHQASVTTVPIIAVLNDNGELVTATYLCDPNEGLTFKFYYSIEISSEEYEVTMPIGDGVTDGTYHIVPCVMEVGSEEFTPMQYAEDFPVVMTVKGNKATFSDVKHTAIKGIEIDEDKDGSGLAVDSWFSLSGQRLSGKPSVKGLYIRNGRKVLVK